MHGWDALYIFMLAAFTGYEVIGRVPVILHTPLMSGSNFIHGIVVVGSMVALGGAETNVQRVIGFIGVLLGAANAVGGYAVTDRMLEMFKSSRELRSGEKGGDESRAGGPPATASSSGDQGEAAPAAAASVGATPDAQDAAERSSAENATPDADAAVESSSTETPSGEGGPRG